MCLNTKQGKVSLLSGVPKRQWAQTEIQEILSECKKNLFFFTVQVVKHSMYSWEKKGSSKGSFEEDVLVNAVTSLPSLTAGVQGDSPYVPGHRRLTERGYPNLSQYILAALTPVHVHALVSPVILHKLKGLVNQHLSSLKRSVH